MAQTILVFDFGTDEDAAQQARHKIEGWKQGFRLGNKMMLKFERPDAAPVSPAEQSAAEEPEEEKPARKAAAKGAKVAVVSKAAKGEKSAKGEGSAGGRVRVMIRLFFSDHEKLTQQRWLDRIPSEDPFKKAKAEVVRQADPEFAQTAETFDLLD
jgi:hypothetical protein